MTKLTRSEQARINGRRSHGPVTPEGKARSARNAIKHGRYARPGCGAVNSVVLRNEDHVVFHDRLGRLRQDFLPINSFEESLVRELAAVDWEIDRISAFRTHTLDLQIAIETETIRRKNGSLRGINALDVSTFGCNKLIETSKTLQFYGRELTRLQKARRDVLHTLIAFRKNVRTFERSEEPIPLQELDPGNEPELPDLESTVCDPPPAPGPTAPPVLAPEPEAEPAVASPWPALEMPNLRNPGAGQPPTQPDSVEPANSHPFERRPAA